MPISTPAPAVAHAAGVQTSVVQSLLIDPSHHPRGQAYLSAASGLVRQRQHLYVVADDELHLGIFEEVAGSDVHGVADVSTVDLQPRSAAAPLQGTSLRLLEGDLPPSKSQLKKAKPDFETLALLPAMPGCPAGALLVMGSGSRPNREVGVLVALNGQGEPNGRTARVNLASLYAPLRRRFPDLNVEGAFVTSGELLLLQRGNTRDPRSACIRYEWNLIAPWLAGLQEHPPGAKSVQHLSLGSVDGVPLSLTDGTALQGGSWMFCAVAERTANSVQDGPCVGAVIGTVAASGQVCHIYPLQGAPKVEGIAVRAVGDDWLVTMVTDPDDRAIASQLLQVRVPRGLESKLPVSSVN